MLHIDFETRSRVDLLRAGAHTYAKDLSTEILMMSWAFEDEPAQLWLPGSPFPERIRTHIKDGGAIAAFNAQFERLIMWYILCPDFDVPEPTLEQFYCVAAQARVNALPGNLDDCARCLNAAHKKDHRGRALIKRFSIPNAYGDFNLPEDFRAEWEAFCRYCLIDTETERSVNRLMRPLTDAERHDYVVCERINDIGMRVDVPLATAAIQYADAEQEELLAQVRDITDGQILKVRGPKITQWVYNALSDDLKPVMHVYKDGEQRLTFDRSTRQRLLEETLSPPVRQLIEAADGAQAASTAKFLSMKTRADVEDERVKGAYIFNGAATGRYTARGLQPHNLPRKVLDNVDEVREAMLRGAGRSDLISLSGMNIMQTLKGLLRPAVLAAPGHTFVCGDWEQIEGRVNPWLAIGLDASAEAKLAIYADPDRDVYCETASSITGEHITKDDSRRQGYGKVPELALGFGGGPGAFAAMAHAYGVQLEAAEVERIVKRWRAANPWAPTLWKALFDAAVAACLSPGELFHAGRVTYQYQDDVLECLLPSGRTLSYPHARCEWKENRFGNVGWELTATKAAWRPKADEKGWPRNSLWPGLLCENVTQAVAADVLRDALAEALHIDLPVVGHTHDEILLEVTEEQVPSSLDKLTELMTVGPEWSAGLPLAAEIWTGNRYRK